MLVEKEMRPNPRRAAVLLALAGALALPSCGRPPQQQTGEGGAAVAFVADAAAADAAVAATGADDPDPEIARMLDEFREGLLAVDALHATAPSSRDELTTRFVRALAAHDTAALRALHVSAAEFAFLYYPASVYTRPPYRQDPALRWFLMQQASEKGIGRALQRLGGRDLRYDGIRCPEGATALPGIRLWEGCTIRIDRGAGSEDVRLFGAILERDGRFKYLSYANDL